jgi:phospholipase/carboxylesterase
VGAALQRRVRLAGLGVGLALLGCAAETPAKSLTLEQALAADWSSLEVQVVGAGEGWEGWEGVEGRQGAAGGTVLVFLHGYGSSGRAHVPLARTLAGDGVRVVLPTAVLPHPAGGAMWWEFVEPDWPKPYWEEPAGGEHWPAPSRQLPRAREAIVRLLADVRSRYRPDALVLAGHSQGAMLALDVAVRAAPPPDGVALVGGYLLLDTHEALAGSAVPRFPVLVSHGRDDDVVAFERAELLRDVLARHGFAVRFAPHDGGHGVEAAPRAALERFLAAGRP